MVLFSILLQVLALVFGYATGRHDVPAVDNFTFHGSTPKAQAAFHRFNWLLKVCFALTALAPLCFDSSLLWPSLSLLTCTGLIVWAVFDPTVAVYRDVFTPPKKPWYYLSRKSNRIDAFLVKRFGDKAGQYKMGACMIFVIFLNLLNFL